MQNLLDKFSIYLITLYFSHIIQQMQPQKPQKPKPKLQQQNVKFSYSNTNMQQKISMPKPIITQQMSNASNEFEQNIDMNFEENCNIEDFPFQDGSDFGLRLLNKKKQDEEKKVVAVIVSFVNGASYDELFTSVQQKSQEGTKVIVYACGAGYLPQIIKAFEGEAEKDEDKQLMKEIDSVDPDSVVFNWECSSNYYGNTFTEGPENLFKFLKIILERKHMAMFSDFSLKALINDWKQEVLGANPFKKIGETSEPFQLCFTQQDLEECPSAQLQIVGQMAEGGKCNVEAMGGTIVYTVDQHVKSEMYDLKVLTVVSNAHVEEEHLKCKIGEHTGAAGHVLLTFKCGGHLLTSMGHWIELMKIDTSEKKLFEIAEREYGLQRAQKMRMEYEQLDECQQKSYVQMNSVNFVQASAPCQNMATKAKKAAYKKKA